MSKTSQLMTHRKRGETGRCWSVIRFSVLMMIGVMWSFSARAYSQEERVNLNVVNVNAAKLFEEIRRQTDYSFFYNAEKLEGLEAITIQRENLMVKDVLNQVLANTSLTHAMVDNVIIIKEKEVAETSQEQTRVIQGKITDFETGETIADATIMVKGLLQGTRSDEEGMYRLEIPAGIDTLVFSHLSYEKLEVPVGESTVLNVQLIQLVNELEGVVVNGYQTIEKRVLTSSVGVVSGNELELKNALTVDQMLEGKAAGLQITTVSSTPGASTKIRIRGGNTFTGNQSPLWVIDGVIYEDPVLLAPSEINSFDNVNLIGNALTGINPRDIESINVLKDASATAIYGVRAANGVIAITTKRGKVGKPRFTYSQTTSLVSRPQYSDFSLMNSMERIAVSREMYEKNLGTPVGFDYENVDRIGYEGALMNYWDGTYDFNQFQDQVGYLETLNADWFDALYRNAVTQNHNVSVSGGSGQSRYFSSVGYDKQEGVERGVDLSRITARANLDFDLRDNILLSLRMNGSVQEAEYNHSSVNVFNEAYYTSRTVPVYDEQGQYAFLRKPMFTNGIRLLGEDGDFVYGRYHVLNEIDNSDRTITNKDLGITASLKWDFLEHFTFRSQASYRNTTNLQEEWIKDNTFFVAQLRTYDFIEDYIDSNLDNRATVPFGGLYSGGMVSQNTYAITNQLNFNKVFANVHVFNVNLAQEARSVKHWGASGFTVPGYSHDNGRRFTFLPRVNPVANGGLDFEGYPYDNMINWFNSGQLYPSITDRTTNSLSFFGMFNYVYDNRYILNFNLRSDGTNTFGQIEEYRFKPTWSVSSRWNIHNEGFWNKSGKVDEFALRTSYGIRGTIPMASPYMTIRNYGPEINAGSFPYGENVAQLVNFPQTNLKWELNKTFNVGLNYSMFEGRLSGAFDYAYSYSEDLLLMRPVSAVNGSLNQQFNAGSKDVQSYEFSVRSVNIRTRDFAWSTRFNISHNIDRVLKGFEDALSDNNTINQNNSLTIGQYLNGGIFRKGFPSSGFYSYQFTGLDANGLPTFKHLNEPDLTPEDQLQLMLKYEGQRTPQYFGSFGTEFKFRRFALTANLNYQLGYKTRLLSLYNGSQQLPLPYENIRAEFNDRWRQPGDENSTDIPTLSNDILRVTDNASNANSGIFPAGATLWNLYDLSDARTADADHIRLSSLTMSYNLPVGILENIGVRSLNLGVQGSNLAVWAFDSKLKGQDPNQVMSLGLPNPATYSINLNVGL